MKIRHLVPLLLVFLASCSYQSSLKKQAAFDHKTSIENIQIIQKAHPNYRIKINDQEREYRAYYGIGFIETQQK